MQYKYVEAHAELKAKVNSYMCTPCLCDGCGCSMHLVEVGDVKHIGHYEAAGIPPYLARVLVYYCGKCEVANYDSLTVSVDNPLRDLQTMSRELCE